MAGLHQDLVSRQFRADRPDQLRVTDNTREQVIAAIDRNLYGRFTSS